jgi:hypothetical protein
MALPPTTTLAGRGAPAGAEAAGDDNGRAERAVDLGPGRIAASAAEAPNEYVSEFGIKWISGGAGRRCGGSLCQVDRVEVGQRGDDQDGWVIARVGSELLAMGGGVIQTPLSRFF